MLPLILWLALAADRPRHGEWWAGVVAVFFWIAPIWWVPHSWWPSAHPVELTERGWQLGAGNSFCVAMAVLLATTSVMLWRRRSARGPRLDTAVAPSVRC
ncbi:MAG TPA: hypothetical protein VNF07_06330 [Acidimicrobiales bacterium]|nr:hypothetical protein [Acidimicrobiales bacterium]